MSESTHESASPDPALQTPPVRRRFWKSMLLSLVIFSSGAIVGTCAMLMFVRQQVHHRIHHPEEMPNNVSAALQWKLDLSDEQTLQVKAVLTERQQAIQQIRREFQPQLESELDLLETQVADLLDDTQSTTWRKRFQAIRAEWLPAAP